jgi:4-amino-4-deoxy-L-arabinose transferase-like glycosyltransferase
MSKKKPKTAPSQVNAIGKSRAPFLLWLDSRQAEWILVSVVLILATSLRLWNVNSPLMWLDEIATLGMGTAQYSGGNERCFPQDKFVQNPRNTSSIVSAEPLSEVFKMQTTEDVHPPGFYIVFYAWRKIFGDGFASVRMPSVLPSIASILLLFLIGKQLFDKRTGLLAALLMSLATPQIIYADHVRPYCFLIFLGLLTTYLLLQIEKDGPSLFLNASLAIFSFALAFTHYFSFGFLLALGIYSVLRLRGKSLWCTIASFVSGGVIFLIVWGPSMWNQFFGEAYWKIQYYQTRQNARVAEHALNFLSGWAERMLVHLPIQIPDRPPDLIFVFLLFGSAVIWKRNLLLPWLLLLGTVGFVWGMDVYRDTFHFIEIRYTLMAAPALYLVIAAGIFNGKRQNLWNSILPIALSAYLITQIPKAYTPYKENWFEMAELVNKNGAPTDPIILPLAGDPSQAYWPKFIWTAISYYFYNPNRPMLLISKPLNNDLLNQIGWGRGAWIFTRIPEFPQSASRDWPSLWVPGCKINGAWVTQERATVYHITLPDKPSTSIPTE